MNDRLALLRAMLANPADNSLRLVFADWLDENGTSDADTARAECIRMWFSLKPGLRTTTRTIAKWLGDNWRRLWPSVLDHVDRERTQFRARGRSLAGTLWWGENGANGLNIKVFFDRGFAEVMQFGMRYGMWSGYERFVTTFAADEPLARFEPTGWLSTTGQYPNATSVVRMEDWGEQVFSRLSGFNDQPSPSEKVYATLIGDSIRGGHSSDRGRRAIADAMTAFAREANGLADPPTPPEPS